MSERWVIRVPIPGMNPWVAESLNSKVATMNYVSAKTDIPVPPGYASYSSKDDNIINSPFIIMEFVQGKTFHQLGFQRGRTTPQRPVQRVYDQIGNFILQLMQLEFAKTGALGYPSRSHDVNEITVVGRPITMNMTLQQLEGYRPDKIMKPKTTFMTARGFLKALVKLSKNHFNQSPPDVQLDQLRGRSLLYAHRQFQHIIVKDWLAYDKGPSVLVHGDCTLPGNNVLVDEDFNATAVIELAMAIYDAAPISSTPRLADWFKLRFYAGWCGLVQ
ncbi:hypothetical protein C2857_000086 [Epichloe festucae Fl1]|uniref:Aminoglycoside phosphotransferase domain-containing protein n=1 Tax=Epichloe festucae (strain Fl1) TaxID=877507 RepID=A0A7U3Q102_EPIFF|nr:hypothetical protein C2857_000086 [Epichloe festucae Fl1]